MIKKGDVLVFIKENVEESHFNNFEFGQKYIVSDVCLVSLGHEEECSPEMAVYFEKHNYGCYLSKIDQYFISIDNFRYKKISEII